jgi:hypothetical protein
MIIRRSRRRLTAWFACLAILLNALPPSHAGAGAGMPAGLLEICSAQSRVPARLLPADADVPAESGAWSAGGHCALCVSHGDGPLLPTFPGLRFAPASTASAASQPASSWLPLALPPGTAFPRAPPLSC